MTDRHREHRPRRDLTQEPAQDLAQDLAHHGDAELAPGLVDLAVNVRRAAPPPWLARSLSDSLHRLIDYPDPSGARAALAGRHRRRPAEVLPTAGAAEAFVLLARALRPRHPVVVHPQFSEPEAALRAAGHPVHRLLLEERSGFTLDPDAVPDDADLVVIGNPTNPTSTLHPADAVAALARPGRVLVVDEAFADTVPGEPASLATRADVPGLVVVRSITKTWGLAGLRAGYLLADPDLVRQLTAAQPLWPVSTPALAALAACASPEAVAAERQMAMAAAADRDHLVRALSALRTITVLGRPTSTFVLVRCPGGVGEAIRHGLRTSGFAVRRGGTFPGLGPDHLRIAVRDRATTDEFVAALRGVLASCVGSGRTGPGE
jgi:histidinol-phosphate aminotransferase